MAITWDTIGVVLCKSGQHKRAIRYHRRALTNYVLSLPLDHPAIDCICEHLGDAYQLLGKRCKAGQYYTKSERMARAHLKTVRKDSAERDESDEDIIIRTVGRMALDVDTNASANPTDDACMQQNDETKLH